VVRVIIEVGYVLAGLMIIMIPGFLFSVALFPKANEMDFWKRMGTSLALGMMLVVYQVVVLAKFKSMTTGPFLASVVVTTLGMSMAVYLRKGTETVRAYVYGALNLPKRVSSSPLFRKLPKLPRREKKPAPKEKVPGMPPPKLRCPACGHLNPADMNFCTE